MLMDIILAYLLLGAIGAEMLFLWFNTNAFVEYLSFFHLGKSLAVPEFKEVTASDPVLTYPEFIVTNYNSFLTRLFSCPKCLGTQIAIFLNIILFSILQYKLGSWIWLLLPFSSLITSYSNLYMYYSLIKLMKHE